MTKNNSLYIPKRVLVLVSGIDEKIIEADIRSSLLRINTEGLIWYRDASQYVCAKWNEGKILMYDPNGGEPDNNFSSRILSFLDDAIGSSSLFLEWKSGSNKK